MMDEKAKQAVVVYGSPFEGLAIIGPFESFGDALMSADVRKIRDGWWVVELEPPEEEEK